MLGLKGLSWARFSALLKDKAAYIIFFLTLCAASTVFIQTLSKTPFLPGGRGSIEYLHITGLAEGFGYSRLYKVFTLISLSFSTFSGSIIASVKASIMLMFFIYFIGLYTLSSNLSSRWFALAVVPTAFLPMVSDTIFKGDYALFTTVAFATLFLAGVCAFLQKPSRLSFATAAAAAALAPLSDPEMLQWLSPMILASIFLCALLSGRRLAPHFITLATVYSATALLSLTIFAGLEDGLWRPNPINQFLSNIVVAITFAVASLVGMLSLYLRGHRRQLYLLTLWLSLAIICSIFDPKAFSFTLPALSALSASSLYFLKDAFSVKKSLDEYEVEVSLDRLSASIPAVLLILLLLLAIPSTIVLGDHEIVPPPRVEDIVEASKFLSSFSSKNSSGNTVVAHPSLANWLLASSASNVLPVLDDRTFKAADLLTTTSFRLMNNYLKVDDWEPFSASKAPLIHVYDGKSFRPLVYVDDSFSRAVLLDSKGGEFIESPYHATFLGYWWNDSEASVSLTMSFKTPGLIINKTITLEKEKPKVSIEYNALVVKKGVSLKEFYVNVYSLPMDILPKLEIVGGEASMDVDGVRLRIGCDGNVSSISQDRTKDQRYVVFKFNPVNGARAYAGVWVEALNPSPSGERLWYSSFYDEAKRLKVGYIIVPREHQVFMENALPSKIDNFIVKDSFVRFIVNSWGNIFQEAPAYAQVLNESVQEDGRTVLYKTAGLYIEKKVRFSQDCLNITYNVQPHKDRTQLIASTLSVWIDWGRSILSSKISGDTVTLALDSGTFQISFTGNVSDIALEPHPEYGQMRVIASFQLKPSHDIIGLSVKSEGKLLVEYVPTSRPLMKDNDEITVSTEGGVFEPVKTLKLYTIYKILP
jgi:hypothetical protein